MLYKLGCTKGLFTYISPHMDFLKNLTHEHLESDTKSYDAPPIPATKQEDSGDNILERFANKLNISEAPNSAAATVPEHKSLFDKLGDAVDGLSGKRTPPPPPAPEKSDSIFEKIGEVLKGPASPPPPPPQPEGLFDKISDALHGGEQDKPKRPQTLGDKVGDRFNNMLGGGAAGEAKEDNLDKGKCEG